jgi:formate dehydrogenase subunit gamma
MSVQSLAQDLSERVGAIVDDCAGLEGPLLPILHGVQAEFGFVPQTALRIIAEKLNLSRAEVHGVMSFYHDFRDGPAGRHVLKICRAEACQAMGGERIAERAQAALGVGWNETAADGSVTLEPVYCLGLCACAPSAMLDGRVVGRLDEERLGEILDEVRR